MALDEAIAENVRASSVPPTLRLYGWDCLSVSLGSFQPLDDIDDAYCAAHGISVVRRPTGGRAILHGDELTYSFSAPVGGIFGDKLMDAYAALSAAFLLVFQRIGLDVVLKSRPVPGKSLTRSSRCFASVSFGELTVEGRKIIGSAQKRWPDGFLQQGSIPFAVDQDAASRVFRSGSGDNDAIGLKYLLDNFNAGRFSQLIRQAFEDTFAIPLVIAEPDRAEADRAQLLAAEKYRNPEWTAERKRFR